MFGRKRPNKMSPEELRERQQELSEANISRKERSAMIRGAFFAIMPIAAGMLCILALVAWAFVSCGG